MREDFWEFAATHKLWLAANHKPTVRGTDNGIWRRIKLIPFTVTIPPEQQDRELPDKLLAELPGILCWAIQGAIEWQDRGLDEPDVVRRATDAYRKEEDVIGRFIDDCCEIGDGEVGATELFKTHKQWCDESGERHVNQTRFGERLSERGFQTRRGKGGRKLRIGLTLLSSPGL